MRGITHDPKARVLAEHAGNAGLFIDLEDSIKFVKMYLDKGKTANGQFFRRKNDPRAFARSNTTSKWKSIIGMGFEKRCDRLSSNSLHTGYTGTFLLIDLIDQTAFIFYPIVSIQKTIVRRILNVAMRSLKIFERESVIKTNNAIIIMKIERSYNDARTYVFKTSLSRKNLGR